MAPSTPGTTLKTIVDEYELLRDVKRILTERYVVELNETSAYARVHHLQLKMTITSIKLTISYPFFFFVAWSWT